MHWDAAGGMCARVSWRTYWFRTAANVTAWREFSEPERTAVPGSHDWTCTLRPTVATDAAGGSAGRPLAQRGVDPVGVRAGASGEAQTQAGLPGVPVGDVGVTAPPVGCCERLGLRHPAGEHQVERDRPELARLEQPLAGGEGCPRDVHGRRVAGDRADRVEQHRVVGRRRPDEVVHGGVPTLGGDGLGHGQPELVRRRHQGHDDLRDAGEAGLRTLRLVLLGRGQGMLLLRLQ